MKKIIRLTETQLEDIIRKVIAEQDTEGTELWKDAAGVEYKLPGITDSEAWSRYVNFGGGRYATAMKMLRNLGLRTKSGISMQPNPMDVGIRWNEVKTLDDPRAKNADRLLSIFQDGLQTIAQTGLQDTRGFKTPEFKNALAEVGTKAADVERLYDNYYDVLQKLGQYQMKFIES